jgi:creatinine amidohydrolase
VTTDLSQACWPALADQRDAILAVPLGSTEQHGPHLPLSTDTKIAVTLCARLQARRPADVFVAPPLPYGSSGEHAAFPGTLSIGQDALELVLVELGRSATETFGHVVFVSGHGGNLAPLHRAVTKLTAESRNVLAFMPRSDGDAHAGRTETSVMLAIAPASVRCAEAVRGDTRPLADILPQLRSGGVRAVSESGVLGDPTGATREEGELILAAFTTQLIDSVEHWREPAQS